MSSETGNKQQQQVTAKNKARYTADPVYESKVLGANVQLQPNHINTLNIDDVILQLHRNKVETRGKCISEGYIKPDSIRVVGKGLGCMENHNFNGAIDYHIKYVADICNPKPGQIMECIIDTINETSTLCYIGDVLTSPVEIYLFRDHYVGNAEYASLQVGDKIFVQVLNSQHDFGDDKILVSGVFLGRV